MNLLNYPKPFTVVTIYNFSTTSLNTNIMISFYIPLILYINDFFYLNITLLLFFSSNSTFYFLILEIIFFIFQFFE